MRRTVIVLSMFLGALSPALARAQVSIGINLPVYPQLVRVPDYPVYYAPGVSSNYFFYDGMYWVLEGDNWYASSWYNGPWSGVAPQAVPVFLLRVPVRYYRNPPGYFRDWRRDAPPRWGDHWGPDWQQQRQGWDRWNRRAVPAPAPAPVYQRRYSGDRYPPPEQQPSLHERNYRYQPRDPVVRERYQEQRKYIHPGDAPQTQPAPNRGQGQGPGNDKGRGRNDERDAERKR